MKRHYPQRSSIYSSIILSICASTHTCKLQLMTSTWWSDSQLYIYKMLLILLMPPWASTSRYSLIILCVFVVFFDLHECAFSFSFSFSFLRVSKDWTCNRAEIHRTRLCCTTSFTVSSDQFKMLLESWVCHDHSTVIIKKRIHLRSLRLISTYGCSSSILVKARISARI